MTRLGGAFWFLAVIASGVTNFMVKQTVQNLDDELTGVRRKTIVAQKEIHTLSADWTYLNQPELLADLNKRHIGLAPMSPKQRVTIDSLPWRPVAPPPAEPAPQIAAVAPPAPAPASSLAAASVAAAAPQDGGLALAEPSAAVTPAAASSVSADSRPAAAAETDQVVLLEPPPAGAPAHAAVPISIVKVPAAAPAPAAASLKPSSPAMAAPSLDALFAQVAADR